MNISSVNKIFLKIAEVQLRWRWLILGAIILFTAFCFSGLPKLKMANNEEEWFEDWEQVKIDSDRFKEIFGSDDAIMVMVQAEDVFSPEVLAGIERLGRRLEEEVPYADKATSIVTAEIPIGSEESIEIKSPFEDGIPTDPAEIKAKKDFILSRESLVNNIVSDDSKESWVILSLENYDGGVEVAAENIARPAQKVILEENEKAAGAYTLKPTGMSYSEMEENDVVAKECKSRVLSGFFVMLLCLVIFVRSLRGVIVPLVATVAGIGSVLGLSAHLGIVADSNMITLPVLLGMALSVGYSVHFVNSFRMHLRRTGLRRDSVVKAVGGVMGYAGYSLDMLTMTIMPMILGIAVDDTIHLINHIKLQLEKSGDYKDAIVVSFREIGKTMCMTTFILCAMFFMYTFSPMGCLFRIGMLAMIGLASALLADYTLTPALIALTKPFGKKIK